MRLNADDKTMKSLQDSILSQNDSLYDGLEDFAKRGQKALQKIGLEPQQAELVEAVCSVKISIAVVEVRCVLDFRVRAPDGIEVIKRALRAGEDVKRAGEQVKVSYLRTPRYR